MNMIRNLSGCPVFKISGELDHHTAHAIRQKLDDAIQKDGVRDIVLDFKNLRFMDSSGIGVLLGRYKLLKKKGGKIYVKNISRNVDKIFTLAGLYQVLIKMD
jgi:stage II sporulation protein AA (anti-sigma F factor antagonist)